MSASPRSTGRPLHDRTEQVDGFGFRGQDLILKREPLWSSAFWDDQFEVPNFRVLDAATSVNARASNRGPLIVNDVAFFLSGRLDGTRQETTRCAFASILHVNDKPSVQAAAFYRQSRLATRANSDADLAFKGLGQDIDERNEAYALQVDFSHELAQGHTVRAGGTASWTLARASAQTRVLPVDYAGRAAHLQRHKQDADPTCRRVCAG